MSLPFDEEAGNKTKTNMEENTTEEGRTLFATPEDVCHLMTEVSCKMMEKSSSYFRMSLIVSILTLTITILGWVTVILLTK